MHGCLRRNSALHQKRLDYEQPRVRSVVMDNDDTGSALVPVVLTLVVLGLMVYGVRRLYPDTRPGSNSLTRRGGAARLSENLNPLINTSGTTAISGLRNGQVVTGRYTGNAISPSS